MQGLREKIVKRYFKSSLRTKKEDNLGLGSPGRPLFDMAHNLITLKYIGRNRGKRKRNEEYRNREKSRLGEEKSFNRKRKSKKDSQIHPNDF